MSERDDRPHVTRAPALASVVGDLVAVTSAAAGGVALASPDAVTAVEQRLRQAGWRVVAIDTTQASSARQAQAVIATALGLPQTAARNLDALADALRDLPDHLGAARRVTLSWRGAQSVAGPDADGFDTLVDVLGEASETLWGQAGSGGFAFETVAFVAEPGRLLT